MKQDDTSSDLKQKISGPFLQPLALFMICLLFVSLILVTGLMDIQRLDRTLASSMENRGSDVIATVQKETQENYSGFMKLHGREQEDTLALLGNEPFLVQESFINTLVGFVRSIEKEGTGHNALNNNPKLLSGNGIWLYCILDGKGKILFQNREVPPEILHRATPVIVGREGNSHRTLPVGRKEGQSWLYRPKEKW